MRHTISLITTALCFFAMSSFAFQEIDSEPSAEILTTHLDPAAQTRSLVLLNEFLWLPDGHYENTLKFQYTEPLPFRSMSLDFKLPLEFSNIDGPNKFGISDMSVEWFWTVFASGPHIFSLGAELFAPTANDPLFGTGKWVIAPEIFYAYYLTDEILIAPGYTHNISFAGDPSRPLVHEADFDFYAFYWPKGQIWSLKSRFSAGYNIAANTWPLSFRTGFQLRIAKLSGGIVVLSIEPGVGIGADRPFDASLKAIISWFGF